MKWKYVALVLGSVAFVVAAYFFWQGPVAKDRSASNALNPAFGEYISGYTAGRVTSGAALRIELARPMVDSTEVGQPVAARLFKFAPSLPGKAYWIDLQTIEFRPDTRLPAGQSYRGEFFLHRLIAEVPTGLQTFTFHFQVIRQQADVVITQVKPAGTDDFSRQQIEGTLETADYAAAEAVRKTVVARQHQTILPITWHHSSDGKHHAFLVDNVVREATASRVTLTVNGKEIATDQEWVKEVEIPALSDFVITSVQVEPGNNQHVVIRFSDPLDESQNMSGLIGLEGSETVDLEIRSNEVRVFPSVQQTGTQTLTVEAGIKNSRGVRFSQRMAYPIRWEQLPPAVRFAGKGNIVPTTHGLVLPIEAVNLKSVQVQVIKIYQANVLSFFQVNDWDGNTELRRVGKPVANPVISLEHTGVTDWGRWNRFTLDLSTLVKAEPGAIYQVRVGFKKEFSALACADAGIGNNLTRFETQKTDEPEDEPSYWDSYEENYYYNDDYDWEQRDNPCHAAYYTSGRTIRRNVMASDLGLLAKQGEDGKIHVFSTDLKTAQPLSGVEVELFDYQFQRLAQRSTDTKGQAMLETTHPPFALMAKKGSQRAYLKLMRGQALALSHFDVGGEPVQKGLKGMVYGERGVWRPGDSLFLTFLLEDKANTLPEAHPVVMELINPQGQLVNRHVRSIGTNGFYPFATATPADASTGNWTARVKVGNAEFSQPIRIETVKPNRLKINLQVEEGKITAAQNKLPAMVQVNWLHGARGRNLQTQFEVTLVKGATTFDRHPGFWFEDITSAFSSETFPLFQGATDEHGRARFDLATPATASPAPGRLQAVIRGKVFEPGGNFSIDRVTLPYFPFEAYTGIRLPHGDAARNMLLTDTTHRVDVITVNADGAPVSRPLVRMSLHKLEWRWWWDQAEAGSANFLSDSHQEPVAQGVIRTVNGKGFWDFKIMYPEWGRFLVVAEDPASGHRTSQVVYIDWPGWAGRARKETQGATMLSFNSDKSTYRVNEKATVVIPGSENGRALVSIENGTRVIRTDWVSTQKGDTPYTFAVSADMAPNCFVHVTLLQPHGQVANDLPVRLYGVIPIRVENPGTRLEPVVTLPDVLEPGKEVTLTVSEKQKRSMTYTVAVVDEGLLDLTRYQTPDPWSRFYAREALGVRTWDVYDEVMGAFSGKIERLLAVGGDAALLSKEDDAKSSRFKPVVKFFGPFTLNGGANNRHTFIMPPYVGSVKTMVVAGANGAYGHAEQVTPVRKALMVLATLPRVLGPMEQVQLPVTVFAMDKSVANVSVRVNVSGPLTATITSQAVQMKSEQQTVFFPLRVNQQPGWATVEVVATSGSLMAAEKISIEVRNPNLPVTDVTGTVVEPGKSWLATVEPIGRSGPNEAVLEVSTLPPVDLGQRLRFLLQYPHGCLEQTTSAAFPQLFVDRFRQLSPEETGSLQRHVRAAIDRIKSFQHSDGSFSYWPGAESYDSWSTTYAGHFLLEAEAKGFLVPGEVLKRWRKFQRQQAQRWRKSAETQSSELIQAYRLYALAFAGDADLSSMNRLREQPDLPTTAAWMLAGAYTRAGQPDAAKKLIERQTTSVKPYQELSHSFGSAIRDQAIILETLVALQDQTRAFELAQALSDKLSNPNAAMTTQETAWALKAAAAFAGTAERGDLALRYTYAGKETVASSRLPVVQVPLAVERTQSRPLTVFNTAKGPLFVRIIRQGIPEQGNETAASRHLNLMVTYEDMAGNPLQPERLEPGTAFAAVVRVTNPGLRGRYQNMALRQVFPSGWEITNLRLDDVAGALAGDEPTYQDVRDDRVLTYFDLNPGQTKTFKTLLTASYTGSFYLPGVRCEAMYDHSIYARTAGHPVHVVQPANP